MKVTIALLALLLALPLARAQEPPAKQAEAPRTREFKTVDRIDLESTAITGNRELPKVMFVVPWKKAEAGDRTGKPLRSLLDEVLEPVDRDVFRRETGFYQALAAPDAQAENSVTPPPAQP